MLEVSKCAPEAYHLNRPPDWQHNRNRIEFANASPAPEHRCFEWVALSPRGALGPIEDDGPRGELRQPVPLNVMLPVWTVRIHKEHILAQRRPAARERPAELGSAPPVVARADTDDGRRNHKKGDHHRREQCDEHTRDDPAHGTSGLCYRSLLVS